MLLTITLNRSPATDLGYLLHKHPAKLQQVDIRSGVAHIFYPEAGDERCTCALLLDLDPVSLVRGDGPRGDSHTLDQYVNDRPYVSSSFMSTAIAKAYSSALNGNCKDKPELVDVALPLEAQISVASVRGADLLQRLFGPLGYELSSMQHPLDMTFPEWGQSRYHTVSLKANLRLKDLLAHLFILLPVLDGDKHYWVGQEEVEKLLTKGEGWLEHHPERVLITNRYLKHRKAYAADVLARLNRPDDEATTAAQSASELTVLPEEVVRPRLHDARLQSVAATLQACGARTVIDLGCGEGKLLRLLWPVSRFHRIAGMDVASSTLEVAADKLNLHRLSESSRPRLQLFQGSLMYSDRRIRGFDAAALVEVIEHLDEDRLKTAARVIFGYAAYPTILITTPNREWNRIFGEDEPRMRHSDHRFEWDRREFAAWCDSNCREYGYSCEIRPLGEEVPEWGAPTQMAVFTKNVSANDHTVYDPTINP